MKILLLGGTRFAGRRLAERLVAAGMEVSALSRRATDSPVAGVTAIRGDRSRPDALDGLDGLRFDAVVDFSAYESSWVSAAAERLAGRVRHYVFISSAAVYSDSEQFPLRETDRASGNTAWGRYAEEKVRAERLLQRAHDEGRFAATLIRLPYVLGPASYADRENFVLNRLAAARPILLPGGGGALNSYIHVDDVAAGLAAVLEVPDHSGGLAFNLGHERAITNRGLVQLLAGAAELTPHIYPVPAQAGTPGYTVDLTDFIFPITDQHMAVDVSRARDVLGFTARRGPVTIAEDIVRWWHVHPDKTVREYPAERRALAAAGLVDQVPQATRGTSA